MFITVFNSIMTGAISKAQRYIIIWNNRVPKYSETIKNPLIVLRNSIIPRNINDIHNI